MTDANTDLQVLSRGAPASAPAVPPPKPHWKTRVLLPGGLLSVFAALLLYTTWDTLWPAATVRVVPVVCQAAQESGGEIACQAAGWVEADPFAVSVSALTDGVVKDVPVLEGQRVKAGDVVAVLVDDDARLALAHSDAELARKQAALRSAKAVLDGAQQEWDNPVARTLAVETARAAVAEIRAELAQLEKEITVAQARVAELEEQLRRESQISRDALPEFQAVRTGLQLKTEQARLDATHARRAVLQAQLARNEADATAAHENQRLRIAERRALAEAQAQFALAEAESRQAQIARDVAQLRLDRTKVRAPSDGVVMARLVAPGSKLMLVGDNMQSAQVARLYNPEQLQVRADVPLADAAKVGLGQAATIVVEVLPDRTFDGEVTRIVNEADVQKNTLQVKVAIRKPAPELKPEMLARIQFRAPVKRDAAAAVSGIRVFAPQRLLRATTAGQADTWIVDKGRGVALRRGVQLGSGRRDGWVEIAAGLQPGDALIEDPPADLRDQQRVRITEAPAGGEHHGSVKP
jgi:RND family efflux transporter MFP subunit